MSVVIATYNYADTIVEAIASALAQEEFVVEVIVIDDGGTDQTKTVVEAHFGPAVYYEYQANRGVCGARNRGVDVATGEWTFFLDADNVLPPRHLATLFAALREHPEATYAYSDLQEFGGSDRFRPMPEFDFERLKRGNIIDAGSLYPTELVRIVRWDERFRYSYEDWDFALRLAAAGHAGVHATSAVGYRRHDTNRSNVIDIGSAGRHRRWRNYRLVFQNNWRFLGLLWPAKLAWRSVRTRYGPRWQTLTSDNR